MSANVQCYPRDRTSFLAVRNLANQAFSRAAGAPLVGGNSVRLLIDAKENYPAWLDGIRSAERYIHFESYIIHEDDAGWTFAEALVLKAREGVRVRVLYDWLGGLGKTSRSFWNYLREGGVEVRCYNPISLDSPFGWFSRDHRKTLTVDGKIGFVTGLCVGRMWVGDPEKNIEPWRDTGIEIRGPSVADIEYEFAKVWALTGEPLSSDEVAKRELLERAGDVTLRVVGGEPASAELLRVDQLVATLARERLWLSDAYYAGTFSYVQALRAAAEDGVDVRLLLPSASDWPFLQPLSRSGYRPLLEAGVRVFEWNGTMMHAKSAVADCMWSRVGSTNLNVVSWFGNFELDVVIEDVSFAREMEQMYLRDLENATEIVLDSRHKVRRTKHVPQAHPAMTSAGGSAGRAAAGAIRLSNAVGAVFTSRRVLEPVEAQLMLTAALLLMGFAVLFWFFPRALTYPAIFLMVWVSLALVYRAFKVYARTRSKERVFQPQKTTKSVND